MQGLKKAKNLLKPRLKLVQGTRLISFLFVAVSIIIAGGIIFAANMYYNIDTGEVVMEEIQRVTNTVRATAGLIIGGTASQDPSAGYVFEVVGKTKIATTTVATGPLELTAADQLLKFTGGTSYYTGFKATTTLTTTTVYVWPGDYPAGSDYYLTADPVTGEMSWSVPSGAGDISAVGDVVSGEAFTAGGSGTTLWFHDSGFTGALTVDTLTADATVTLPNLTGTVVLTDSSLNDGSVLFASSGKLAQDNNNLFWSTSTPGLGIGTSSPAYLLDVKGTIRSGGPGTSGQLRIYSEQGATDYEVVFQPSDSMTTTTVYTWPVDVGTSNYVLTTDGSGLLSWKSVSGAGGVDTYGTPAAGQVSFFYDSDTVTGSDNLFWDSSNNRLGIGTTTPDYALDVVGTARLSTSLIAPLIQYTGGDLTLQTLTSGEIILNSADNTIRLGTGDAILTQGGGPASRITGEQILREAVPILGFDLPVQTATTSYVQISRELENYPFSSALSGTNRVHKLIFRYAASTTDVIDWRIATTTGQTYSSSTLPVPSSNDLDNGDIYIATTTIPTDGTDWWLDIKTPDVSSIVRIYQIFLAAYDQVQ